MPCPETLFGRDLDEVFAYPTVKFVSIRDRRLGLLKYFLTFCIVIYIAVVVLYGQGNFYDTTSVGGTVRFTLREPTDPDMESCDSTDKGCRNDFTAVSNGSYCTQSDASYPGNKLLCEFYEHFGAEVTRNGALLATTRMSTYEQTKVCDSTTSDVCPILYNTTRSTRAYVNDIGRFTVAIDHSIVPDNTELGGIAESQSSSDMNGFIYVKDNKHLCRHYKAYQQCSWFKTPCRELTDEVPCFIKPNTTDTGLDKVSVDMLMAAAQKNLDDMNEKGKTFRETGVQMLLYIMYFNFRDFEQVRGGVSYYYEPTIIKNSDYKDTATEYKDYRETRTLLDRHGLYISAVQGGYLHGFSFNNLVIQVTAALTFFAAANVLTDMLALYVLPQKEVYHNHKYEHTEGFSDLRARASTAPQHDSIHGSGTQSTQEGADEQKLEAPLLIDQGSEASML